jgi:uncharacterized membrane protein
VYGNEYEHRESARSPTSGVYRDSVNITFVFGDQKIVNVVQSNFTILENGKKMYSLELKILHRPLVIHAYVFVVFSFSVINYNY